MSAWTFNPADPAQAWTRMGFPYPQGVVLDYLSHAINWANTHPFVPFRGTSKVESWHFSSFVKHGLDSWLLPDSPALIMDAARSRITSIRPKKNRTLQGQLTLEEIAYGFLQTMMTPLVGYAILANYGTLDQAKAERAAVRTRQQISSSQTITIASLWYHHYIPEIAR